MSEVGFDGACYYNTGTRALPAYVLIDTVRDVSITASAEKADVSDRRSKFKKSAVGMIDLEATLTLTYVPNNTALDYLRDTLFLARGTPVEFYIMDGLIATPGSEGFRFYANVYSNDFAQPLSEGDTINITLAPTASPATDLNKDPEWYTVP